MEALNDFGAGFVMTDGQRFLFANDAYCRITGYSQSEILGLDSVWAVTPPEDRAEMERRLSTRFQEGRVPDRYEARLLHKDGHYVDVDVSAKVFDTSEGPRVVSLIRDITEAKRLRKFTEKFVADAAHELRNPIAILTGMTEILEGSWKDMNDSDLANSVQMLGRQGRRLSALVSNMLDLTRLQQGTLEVAPVAVELRPIVEHVVAALPEQTDVVVHNEVPQQASALGDAARLDQILTNLVTNAIRYGGGNVWVRATESGDAVELSVVDDGPGVPKDLVAELFLPFTRGANAGGMGGAGLGLAIVKELVLAQGGQISYDPAGAPGARFVVTLLPHDRRSAMRVTPSIKSSSPRA